jgi:hypothetical protein
MTSSPRKRGLSTPQRFGSIANTCVYWIPACAGMTATIEALSTHAVHREHVAHPAHGQIGIAQHAGFVGEAE